METYVFSTSQAFVNQRWAATDRAYEVAGPVWETATKKETIKQHNTHEVYTRGQQPHQEHRTEANHPLISPSIISKSCAVGIKILARQGSVKRVTTTFSQG